MARENRRRRRSPVKDWSALSIGIITVSTIVAAATVAAAININRKSGGLAVTNQSDALLTEVADVISILSLGAYLAVAFTGLWALFRKSPMEQEPLVKLSAIGLYAQVFAAVIFASIAIFGPVIAGI